MTGGFSSLSSVPDPAVYDVLFKGFPESWEQYREVFLTSGKVSTQIVGLGDSDMQELLECRHQGGE